MSWAVRRRVLYILGILMFFGIVFGVPVAYSLYTVAPTCTDGKQNQGETAPDRGGPCPLVDQNSLAPSSMLWSRSFRVRDGSYTAVAYIENPNDFAGVANVPYIFRLYDSDNVIVAERTGSMYVMPGGITPAIETNIDTGNRIVAHTFFQFTAALRWEHMTDASKSIIVSGRTVTDADTTPRIEAKAENSAVSPYLNAEFAAVVFDTAGNAFAASATKIDRIAPGDSVPIVFTWPGAFPETVGRVDMIPLVPPVPAWSAVK